MLRNTTATYTATAMDAQDENTPMYLCADFTKCLISLVSASSANATIKVYWSAQDSQPSLSAAVSATNIYTTVWFVYSDAPATTIDGDTWVAWAGTDANYQLVVDCSAYKWIGIEMTARSAGNVTASFTFMDWD